MQVLRLATELYVAPKSGRNKFGCFALDDRFFLFARFVMVPAWNRSAFGFALDDRAVSTGEIVCYSSAFFYG
jgi:hypothetical protein